MKFLKDDDFIRGNVPMTKFDVRVINMALLNIEKEDVLLDVGAGTGSISIQSALLGAKVYAVEKNEEAINIIRQNMDKFNVNVNIKKGTAPFAIEDVPQFNKCFIGGSEGLLKDIVLKADEKLTTGGILLANFITIKNLYAFTELINDKGYRDIETRIIQVSYSDKTGILKANNPVFIVKGVKS